MTVLFERGVFVITLTFRSWGFYLERRRLDCSVISSHIHSHMQITDIFKGAVSGVEEVGFD